MTAKMPIKTGANVRQTAFNPTTKTSPKALSVMKKASTTLKPILKVLGNPIKKATKVDLTKSTIKKNT